MASWLEKLGLQRTRPPKEELKDFCLELCPDNRIASFMITDHTPRSGNPFIRFVKEAARKAVIEEARGVPDNLLLFYAGIRKEELPPSNGLLEKEPRQAWRFIIENGGITDGNSVSLRRAAYLEAHGVETDRRNLEGLEHSPGYKDFVAHETARERILQGKNARFLVTAVKTDQGVRVFNRGLHGPRHLREYLQEIADNFYSPCGKRPGTLSIFRIETSSKRLMEMSRQPGRCFPASHPGLEVFGNYRPVASFELSPTAANLDRFITAGSLELSRRNLDIMTLQDIAEKGYAHLTLEEPSEGCVREIVRVRVDYGGMEFEAETSCVKYPGWRDIYNGPDMAEEGKSLPQFHQGEILAVLETEILEDCTKPQPPFTEAELLAAMENAGSTADSENKKKRMEKCGLGTPGTRAGIIDLLVARRYVERIGNRLIPTEKGLEIYGIVGDKLIADAAMTAAWEKALREIEEGRLSAGKFMKGIHEYARKIVSELLALQVRNPGVTKCTCPKCGTGTVTFYDRVAKCGDPDCAFHLPRMFNGRTMRDEEMTRLMAGEATPFLKFTTKAGKPYEASLRMDENYKVELTFKDRRPEG